MAERCCCSDDTFATLHPGGLPRTVEIVKRLHLPIGSAILDVGCGEGRSVCALAQMGYHAYGIESSAETLSRSHALEGSEDLQWGNAENLPFADESFTCVLFECSLSEMDIPQALAECSRVLEPGGIAVVHDVYDRGGRTCSNSEHPITAIPSKSKWACKTFVCMGYLLILTLCII